MQFLFIYIEPSVSGQFEAYLPVLKHLWKGKISQAALESIAN